MSFPKEPMHINAKIGSIAPIVLMPGDPLRAKYIAEKFLNTSKEVCNLRNMLGYTGYYKGVRVSVIGSGMGIPSMGIYAFELFNYYNVKKIIRIGSCGVLSKEVHIPEVILAKSSYSESTFAYSYNNCKKNILYPSKLLNDKIKQTAKELDMHIFEGNVFCTEVFGPFIDRTKLLKRIPKKVNPIAEEMESFALFHVANEFKRDASALLTATDSQFEKKIISPQDRQTSLNDMIKLALEAIIKP